MTQDRAQRLAAEVVTVKARLNLSFDAIARHAPEHLTGETVRRLTKGETVSEDTLDLVDDALATIRALGHVNEAEEIAKLRAEFATQSAEMQARQRELLAAVQEIASQLKDATAVVRRLEDSNATARAAAKRRP